MESKKGVKLTELNEMESFYWLQDEHLDKGKSNLYPEHWIVAKKIKEEDGPSYTYVINLDDLEDEKKNVRHIKLLDSDDNIQIVFRTKEDALEAKISWDKERDSLFEELDQKFKRGIR